MERTTKFFGLIVIALSMSGCGLFSCTQTEVTIKEDDDTEWRMYDDNNNNQGIWIVDEGDVLTWFVTGSDMIFLFPRDMETYFEFNDGLFSEVDSIYTGSEKEPRLKQIVQQGDSLRLKIKENKIEGDGIRPPINVAIEYDIYVIKPGKYVVGNSPPYLIIRRSHNK